MTQQQAEQMLDLLRHISAFLNLLQGYVADIDYWLHVLLFGGVAVAILAFVSYPIFGLYRRWIR